MKKVKYRIFLAATSVLLCGGFWLVPSTRIKASTKKITEIDSNTSYTYELLETNQRIVEPKFIENIDFIDYVQGETTVHNWQKKHFYSNSLPINAVDKHRSQHNMVNVNDGVVTLDYFSGESEEKDDLNVVQLNKMDFEGKTIKTIYLGDSPSDDYLKADTNYIPLTYDIIQDEQEQTIGILGVQDGVAKIDVFDYDLNQLYSTLIESDPQKLIAEGSMSQYITGFHHATVTNEGNVYIYPKLQGVSSEMNVTLPLFTWSQEFMDYTDHVIDLQLEELVQLKAKVNSNYNLTVENIYFGKNHQMLVEFSFYDLIDRQVETLYTLFDEKGNYIQHLELPNGAQNESSQFGDTIYVSSYAPASDRMTLYEFSFKDAQCKLLKTYEHIQSLRIYEEESELIAYGQTTRLTAESTNMSGESGAFIATLDDAYSFESTLLIPDNQVEISVKNIYKLPNEADYFINGVVTQKDVDSQVIDQINVLSDDRWSESFHSDETTNLFFGTITHVQDYAPMIKAGETMIINKDAVDLSASEVDANGHTLKDRLLLFGNEAGEITTSSVMAYDTYDLQQNFEPLTQSDLMKKINRNPNNPESAIDWLALGFDGDSLGPQRTLYFVTDSQNQVSSTSKIVNLVDQQTVYDDEQGNIALHVENFVIGSQEVARLTSDILTDPENTGQYGNLFAWNLLDEFENCYTEIEIDEAELEAINDAHQFGKFPLTYRFSRNGSTIQQTIFVYVLDDNSEQLEDILFYAKNSMIPWDVSKEASLDELTETILGSTQAVAYNFRTGEDVTDQINLNEEDILLLSQLEPTKDAASSSKNSVMQTVQFMIGEQQVSRAVEMEVYYRFEHIYVSYVDEKFNPLEVSELMHLDVPVSTIENQIVGKVLASSDLMEEIKLVTHELVHKGYQQKGIYLADKTTKLTTNDWMVKCQHGQGNQVYLVFE